MNLIVIHKGATSLEATFEGPHASEIVNLFGSATLPMPYAPSFDLATAVLEQQTRENARGTDAIVVAG
jgi:hypothetical protein